MVHCVGPAIVAALLLDALPFNARPRGAALAAAAGLDGAYGAARPCERAEVAAGWGIVGGPGDW